MSDPNSVIPISDEQAKAIQEAINHGRVGTGVADWRRIRRSF